MTIFQPYKRIIAVIFIAVYAFIATPVQLWHHHHHSKDIQIVNINNTVISKNTNSTSEANCPICQHQYSICNDDDAAAIIIIQPIITFQAKREHYNQQTISSFIVAFSNKGPP